MQRHILPQKSISINDAGVSVHSVVYTGTEIMASTGVAMIQGPFSMALDIDNQSNVSLYIQVSITTLRGIQLISDRVHIGYIAPKQHKIITSATVPSLANIFIPNEPLISITVTFYGMGTIILASEPVTVTITLDEPTIPYSWTEFIGRDAQVYHPGYYLTFAFTDTSISAGTSNVSQVATDTTEPRQRLHVVGIQLLTYPTAFPGDIILKVAMTRPPGVAVTFRELMSKQNEFAILNVDTDIYLDVQHGDFVSILASNINSTNAYKASGLIQTEVLF